MKKSILGLILFIVSANAFTAKCILRLEPYEKQDELKVIIKTGNKKLIHTFEDGKKYTAYYRGKSKEGFHYDAILLGHIINGKISYWDDYNDVYGTCYLY